MLTKQEFVETFKWELDTLLKVIKAIPADNYDYRPHQKSKSAKELANSLIAEVYMTTAFIKGESITQDNAGNFFSKSPQSVEETVNDLAEANTALIAELTEVPEENLKNKVTFFHRETSIDDAIFNMMLDLIHHRGQLSVYIRLAGGLVPSIYGPSADEEFTG